MCHIRHMKAISIRQLHESTGKFVRESSRHPLMILERGQPVAVLKKIEETVVHGVGLPNREEIISRFPLISADSTASISEDRER